MRNLAEVEAAVTAIHPGPGAGYVPPVARVETPTEKLARMEREFLELSLSQYLGDAPYGTGDRLQGVARAIIVQRAQITG